MRLVVGGSRPEIPAPEALPGPDRPQAEDLEAYCQLLRYDMPPSHDGSPCTSAGGTAGAAAATTGSRRGTASYPVPTLVLPPHPGAWRRECWAQEPEARPTFQGIVPRLRQLLHAPGDLGAADSLLLSGYSSALLTSAGPGGQPP